MNLKKTRFVLLLGAFLLAPGVSMADAPGNNFELDGNATVESNGGIGCTAPDTPSGCKDDWDLLNGDGTGGLAGGSLTRSFVSGAASIKVFTTGGSKDPLDISSWKWRSGGTPDKDAITNGYAAAYRAGDDHLILVFGADRFAVNGDANIGIWFFQQDVHPVGTTGGGFSGAHSNNDVFIVSSFTQGGGVSTITVYTWDDTCTRGVKNPTAGDCADSNLRLKFASLPTSSCSSTDEGCAVVNSDQINVTWPYLAKFGSTSLTIPKGGFYEGGLDVNELLGAPTCFSSFLIETRSSQAPSAVLKDFISGGFYLCGMDITKSCAGNGTANTGGTDIHYTFNGTVTNSGVAALNHVTIVDSLPAGSTNASFKTGTTGVATVTCPAGSPVGATCADFGSLNAGAVLSWSVEFDSTALTVENIASARASSVDDAPGACTAAGTVCTGQDGHNTCSTAPNNSITISKNCGVPVGYPGNATGSAALPGTQLVTSNGLAAVQVNFSGTIQNTGNAQLSGITLTDSPAATISLEKSTLAPGESAKYSGYYKPSGVTAGDLGSSVGRYSFSDTIKVTGATAALGSDPGHEGTCTGTFLSDAQACASAPCSVCPPGSCASQ